MEANSIVPQQQGKVKKSQLSSFEHREWRKKTLQIELIAAHLPGIGNWKLAWKTAPKRECLMKKSNPYTF